MSAKVETDEARRLRTRLREVREYLNLSQEFVAKNAGLLRSALADIERGQRKVDSLELHRIARVYRYPVSFFLGDEEVGEAPDDGTLVALNRAAGDLTERDRHEVLRFAQFLRFYGRSEQERDEG
jgi:transcriptional regulator with XRE-family HTH domain